jgi:hypothetical protein
VAEAEKPIGFRRHSPAESGGRGAQASCRSRRPPGRLRRTFPPNLRRSKDLGAVGMVFGILWLFESAEQPGRCPVGTSPPGWAAGDILAAGPPAYYLTRRSFSVNCPFSMATQTQIVPVGVLQDFELPQREAAFFYGLFLRGHSADELRRDIGVPPSVMARWHREAEREPELRDLFERMIEYRRHVLAIFDALVGFESRIQRVQ